MIWLCATSLPFQVVGVLLVSSWFGSNEVGPQLVEEPGDMHSLWLLASNLPREPQRLNGEFFYLSTMPDEAFPSLLVDMPWKLQGQNNKFWRRPI